MAVDSDTEPGTARTQDSVRRAKIARMREAGGRPYPYRYAPDHTARQVRDEHPELPPDTVTDARVRLAGRLVLIRRQGALTFGRLRDRTGAIQLFVDTAVLGAQRHRAFDELDRADWVGVEGVVMTTRRGELSVRVEEFTLLAKAIAPPPDKHAGLTDVETRYRRRYVDLEVNERTREIFRIRHEAIAAIRRTFAERGFTEVEGPVLQSVQGGASARPFITHHNALDLDMYLRIALELHLKRLIVGGMERVFEIGRVFRNEGVDTRHNPEFTMLEAYQAYADYHDVMDLVRDVITTAARAALGDDLTVHYAGETIDLAQDWPRVRFADMITERTGAVMHPGMPLAEARRILDGMGLAWESGWGAGRLMKEVYDEKVQHDVVGPVFCIDYPREVSPLARAHRDDPAYVERFELIVAGFELCNAYSEQNDPVEQLAAFEAEARAKADGDPEAGDIDLDYVRALEQGMPPTGGLGIGIDRLIMLLAGVESIREVILFPTLRPEFTPPDGGPRLVLPPTGLPAPGPPGQAVRAGPPPSVTALSPIAPSAGVIAAAPERDRRGRGAVRVIALSTALAGVAQLLVRLPVMHSRFDGEPDGVGPLWFPVAGHVVSVIVGLLLILLADQLAKHKRLAWRVAVVLVAVAGWGHLFKGPHPVAVTVCVALLVALVWNRDRFRAPADPPSLWRLVRFVPIYVAGVLGFGLFALWTERGRLTPDLSFGGALLTTLAGLVGVDGPYTYDAPFFADFFPTALLALGIAGLLVFLLLLFRPLVGRRPHTGTDWEQANRLVRTYGWDTLAYFSLRRDKSFFFSSDGEAFLAYTYIGGYALVSADPVGARDSVVTVLDEFLAMCDDRAWNPAFLAVREASMPLYASRGFSSFYLGDEAILNCRTFSLDGPERRSVRSATRRVGKRYRFQLIPEYRASSTLVGQLNAISEKWRGKSPERGFTMALSQDVVGEGANPDFLLCVALDSDGVPGGFLRVVPAYGTDFGYTLDLMRHDPGAPNGMTEFLIASSARELGRHGIARLSMNFALWGRLFDDEIERTPAQRVARWAVGVVNPFFQIRSLHDFNEKFGPEWMPRVLAYRRARDLPRVGLLYAGAEGFLSVPVLGELFVPKEVGTETTPAGGGVPATGARSGVA
jgi:lysyl-tRNA synthetase